MSYSIFPAVLGAPYSERFVHVTARAQMGGGRLVTAALIGSAGLFTAEGSLLVPQSGCTFDTLAAFVAARRGSYDSFLYLPAYDYHGTATAEAVGTGDGAEDLFALDLKYPKTGTFTVTVGGTPSVEGVGWNLADSDGNSFALGEVPYIKFASPPAGAAAIVATYRHYIPVRFEDDDPLGDLVVLGHTGDSSADTHGTRGGILRVRQDSPGSHLVTVPSP